ncbi:Hypothetical predicted protein [Podarcis lilfordi]|uniref:Uncharacterized protein n=1 Tax=Podarcis lilfordi TaxID=74358 RepID=A0AA35PBM2_9SAUR|nr:Hypothetical predicted protein [Podarcis lilfordi]
MDSARSIQHEISSLKGTRRPPARLCPPGDALRREGGQKRGGPWQDCSATEGSGARAWVGQAAPHPSAAAQHLRPAR